MLGYVELKCAKTHDWFRVELKSFHVALFKKFTCYQFSHLSQKKKERKNDKTENILLSTSLPSSLRKKPCRHFTSTGIPPSAGLLYETVNREQNGKVECI